MQRASLATVGQFFAEVLTVERGHHPHRGNTTGRLTGPGGADPSPRADDGAGSVRRRDAALGRRDPARLLRFLDSVREQYGDLVQLPIPTPPTYLVTDPAAVRRVLVTNARAYGKRTLQYTTLALVTGEGLC